MTSRRHFHRKKRGTRRNQRGGSKNTFEEDIANRFFEVLMTIKLYHWKTYSYASHKATDELYSSLNEKMDQFMEILLGKMPGRMNFYSKGVRVHDYNTPEQLKSFIADFKGYMESITDKVNVAEDSDLLTVRDEVLADLNKFSYLLTLK